jgi:Nif-specific regulatory protein
MAQLLDLVGVVAPKDVRILIRGETGTGKKLIAEAVHDRSERRDMPFIKVNCAALTRESERS